MKKIYTLCLSLAAVMFANSGNAQTYSSFGLSPNNAVYDSINNGTDTLYFNFTGLAAGGYDNATIEVWYEGWFGWGGTYTPILPGGTMLATYGGGVSSCTELKATYTVLASTITAWGGTGVIKMAPDGNNQPWCDRNRAKVKITYNYCSFGYPTAFATGVSLADSSVCSTSSTQALTGLPAGGVFSGTGVSGSNFNPAGLAQGTYVLNYALTDNIGCITYANLPVKVLREPASINQLVCENSTPTLDFGNNPYSFSSNLSLIPAFDTTNVFTFPSVVNSPTTYYYGKYSTQTYYQIDTFTATSYAVIDHNSLTNDDRSGIAITDSSVYIVGDSNTGRFELDLTNGVSLPIRDGIFTDLSERKIYSLYNTTTSSLPPNDGNPFELNALIELDADLNVGALIVPLSQTIILDNNSDYVGIYSGFNTLIVNDGSNNYYSVEISSGAVTPLGIHNLNEYGSETWAIWGVAGFNGTEQTVYYRNSSSQKIEEYVFGPNVSTPVSDITQFSDMACFIIHPINNRLYFHYEGGSPIFGGSSETLGYTDLADSIYVYPGGSVGCPAPINFTFNSVNLGADTAVCNGDGLYILEAGLGYSSYSWNGVNNNWNIFPVQDSGAYIVNVVDEISCILRDTIVIDVNECATSGLEDQTLSALSVYPIPSNGTFTVAYPAVQTNATIELFDMNGRVLYTTKVESGSTSNTMVTSVESGVYFVRFTTENGTSQLPIIVE